MRSLTGEEVVALSTSNADAAPFDAPSAELSLEELADRRGVRPVTSLDELRADIWESDEELDAFLDHLYASRRADVG